MSMLLAVDTSTQWMGLALYDGSQVLGESAWKTSSHHTVELAPALDDLLHRTGIAPADLRALGVARGPGSFTSLRIGLALIKGLALALRLPVVGVPSLDVLASAQPVQDLTMVTTLQVGRGRLAVGWYAPVYGKWLLQGEPQLMTTEDLVKQIKNPTLICGELSTADRQALARKRKNVILASPAQSLRRPAFLAELAWQRWQAGEVDEVVSLSPIYLRTVQDIPS
jgi:tRNA threonylcarbamoyladenosine biosynthesis protein TsaB